MTEWKQTPLPDGTIRMTKRPTARPLPPGRVRPASEGKPPWAIGRVFPCTVTDELALPGGDSDSTARAPSAGQDTGRLRDEIAEQAWGVLVEADLEGVTDPNLIAHAIVRNQMPAIAKLIDQRDQAREQVARVRGNVEAIIARLDPDNTMWRDDLRRALDTP